MTPADQLEHSIAYLTALGRMCGASEPTRQQERQARAEADEHIAALHEQESLERWKAKKAATNQ